MILKDGFAKVAADELLKEKDFGEHAIPVVSLETVLSEEEPVEKSRLLFAGKGSRFSIWMKICVIKYAHRAGSS